VRALFGLCLALALGACGDDSRENLAELATVESPAAMGLELRELPASVLRSIGLSYGLVVVKADGLSERAGLRMGDVVYGVDRKKVGSLAEFRQLVAAPREDNRLGLLVRRGASDFYVALDLGGMLPTPGAPRRNLPPRETPLRT
jgi:S1-C subfamily serine protease